MTCDKENIRNPATCSCENGKSIMVIIDDSVITCDETIDLEETRTVRTSFNEKKNATFKTKNFYIFLFFLLMAIALFIVVSIYCYLIKYKAKQKYLLPCHVTNNKFKKFCINNIL